MKKSKGIIYQKGIVLCTFLVLLLSASCESVLFIELEESDKLIVLNGALSNDSIVSVQVSRTRHILDNANLVPLEEATVTLFREGNQLEQLLYHGNGFYQGSGFHPQIGEVYSIEVEQAGFPPVSAQCVIPEKIEITSIDTSTVIQEFDDYGYFYSEEMFQMDVSINDPSGVDNYYLLNLEVDRSYTEWRDTSYQFVDSLFHNGEWYYYVSDTSYAITEIHRYVDHPRLSSPDLVVEAVTDQGILFSDQLIDGKHYSVRVSTWLQAFASADSALVDIRLHSISESYYRYLKSRQKHFETRDDPFAVPVIVFTNVDRGTGFLGGYSSDVHSITTFVPEFGNDYWYYEYD